MINSQTFSFDLFNESSLSFARPVARYRSSNDTDCCDTFRSVHITTLVCIFRLLSVTRFAIQSTGPLTFRVGNTGVTEDLLSLRCPDITTVRFAIKSTGVPTFSIGNIGVTVNLSSPRCSDTIIAPLPSTSQPLGNPVVPTVCLLCIPLGPLLLLFEALAPRRNCGTLSRYSSNSPSQFRISYVR